MKTAPATVGARGVDSLAFSQGGGEHEAKALRAAGIDYFVGYLGSMTAARLAAVLGAGLAFMPCTYADAFNGQAAVQQCQALALPPGCTVWLDLEGKVVFDMDPAVLIAKINAWAEQVAAAGYEPGLYVGSPQPLTGPELYALKVVRYWKAPSRVFDRHGVAWDGPECGWCQYQTWPSTTWAGVWVDVDFVQEDFKGRVPHWVVGS